MTSTKSRNAEGTKAQLFENRFIDPSNGQFDREAILNHYWIIELRLDFAETSVYQIWLMVQLQLRSGLNGCLH